VLIFLTEILDLCCVYSEFLTWTMRSCSAEFKKCCCIVWWGCFYGILKHEWLITCASTLFLFALRVNLGRWWFRVVVIASKGTWQGFWQGMKAPIWYLCTLGFIAHSSTISYFVYMTLWFSFLWWLFWSRWKSLQELWQW
jgi:hypothetical protein